MELIRGDYNLRAGHRGGIATIGNFDGLHLGHRHVLEQLTASAAEQGRAAIVMLFEPMPREYFQGNEAPARLMRLREKLEALQRFPIDRLVCLRFGRRLASMDAEAFIRKILVNGLGIEHLIVGDDFRFGRGRKGDFEMLARAGRELGFAVTRSDTYRVDGQRVSSTAVREALAQGDMARAERLLGHRYYIRGRVTHGDRRGRGLGFPTANIPLRRRAAPVSGVFAVEVHGVGDAPLAGVANIGTRPIVNGTKVQLEVTIFDFDDSIYGRLIRVDLLHRLRDEVYFDSFEALRQQMERDAAAASEWLRHH